MLLEVLCFISLCQASSSAFIKNNPADLSKCKLYYSRSGAAYKDFFEISEEALVNGTLDFHFSVLAGSNAHVLLAPSSSVEKGDPAYEIVIGAGGNVFSDIRRSQKSQVKATKQTPGILSGLDLTSFWIHISSEGLIEVGKEGEEKSFISWQDQDPLPLKVFSFSTWTGVEAKWYFDCPDQSDKIPDSKAVVRNITFTESLREDLLYTYDPYVRPVLNRTDFTVVSLSLTSYYVNLDIYRARLQMKGTIQMKWQDAKLKWDPSDYGKLSSVHVRSQEIWKPPLLLFNAVGSGQDYISNGTMAVVTNNGTVVWSPTINIEVWCDPKDLGTWPNDIHECDLLFGFLTEHYYMKLDFFSNTSTLIGKTFATGWDVIQIDVTSSYGWESVNNRTVFDPPSLYLLFKLKMDSRMYNILFHAAFVAAAVMLLSTFWVCPLSYVKISLNCFQLILTSLTIVVLSYYVPPHPEKIPYFVLLHSSLLIFGLVSVAVSIFVINLSRNEHEYSLPQMLLKLLTFEIVQWALFLPETKSEGSSRYGQLKETTANVISTTQDGWILLGTAIDRICFLVFSSIIVAAAALKY